MALADYVQRTRAILTGYGLGEKPVMIQVAADAVNTVSGDTVLVTVLDGTNSGKIRPGDVLSTWNPSTEALAWTGYVLAVDTTTDVITCVNGYAGTTVIANAATTHDAGVLMLHGEGSVTDHEIVNAINLVLATMLWPAIFKLEFDTETANLSGDGRIDLDAEVEEIDKAWQIVGNEMFSISFGLEKQAPSVATPGTAGVVGTFDPVAAGSIYMSTIRRMVVGDDATYPQLVELVSIGASAISAGFSRPETTLAIAKQDSRERGRAPDIGAALWRDFVAVRDAWADDIARETADHIRVFRG